ncbi:MAG: glycerol-3-phosphate responsive antiterminator [Eubacteriales bacterium]|nr:glycerol-3-phosphate responsive antiterminator [Eubacteriales bacterium]
MHAYIETIHENPIIAAVHNRPDLERALDLRVPMIFLLNTDIFSAKEFVGMALSAGSHVFLHMDLIDGLAPCAKALDYVKNRIGPSGIISTKSALIKYAREQGVFSIQRFFMVDSASFDQSVKSAKKIRPSMIELMPGTIPDTIHRFADEIDIPVIAGGLVTTRQQVIDALSSGAIGVSTGKKELWLE